jgi:molecular chaperone DnaK
MIVGIDLGTSTSELSFLRNGKPQLIREVNGSERGILPSVVGVNSQGKIRVGQEAISLMGKSPEFGVREAKREMGKAVKLRLGGEEYSPQEISAFILRHLREEAERYLGEAVTDAVITVPAYFTDEERQATKDAGELAGFRVRRLINEPTAAALAYGLERPMVEEKILVYDLGGGTLDVTVLELSEGCLDVFASTGNSRLGGKDFDDRLMNFIAAECLKATGIDLHKPGRGRDPKKAAKHAKEALSSADVTTVTFDNLGLKPNGEPIDFELDVSRQVLDELIRPLVESTREQLDEALAAKQIAPSDIQTILLVGGSTRIPLVRQFVSEYFGGRPIRSEVSPDEAVSLGAAIQAGIIDQTIDPSTIVITDVMTHSLGVAVQREVEDECVSGLFDPLIARQATIPRTGKKTYQTSKDWQDAVHVQVFQGEAEFCKDNLPIVDFMHPIKPAPAGQEVEIEMSYDLSGLVVVIARDPITGKETRIEKSVGGGHMSDKAKRSAQARIEERWRTGSPATPDRPTTQTDRSTRTQEPTKEPWKQSPLYSKVSALMSHAERRLDGFDPTIRSNVSQLLSEMRVALTAVDAVALDSAEQRLTDLLFDLG